MSVSDPATAPKTCRPPSDVSTLQCRVCGDGDAHGCRYRLGRWDVTKLLADLERGGAQCLGAHANIRRQKMRQHVGGDTKRHQGGEMGAQLIQLRRRSTMRWPSDTGLDVTAADATKSRQSYRHLAEWCREQMASPVVDVTPITTRRTFWPSSRKISRLRGDNRLLHARQKLLRLGQGQPQIGHVARPIGPAHLHYGSGANRLKDRAGRFCVSDTVCFIRPPAPHPR